MRGGSLLASSGAKPSLPHSRTAWEIQDIPRSKQTDGKDGSSVSLCDSFSAFLSLFFFHFLCQNLVHVYACHSCIWSCVSFDGVHNVLRDLLLIFNVMLIRAVISHLILLLTA